MKILLPLIFLFLLNNIYSQSNKKVDSLNNKIIKLQSEIKRLESEIEQEISSNGYSIKVKKKFSFSELFVKKGKYDKVIDTLSSDEKITILARDYSYYKIRTKNNLVGYIRASDLNTEDNDSPIKRIYKFGTMNKSTLTNSSYNSLYLKNQSTYSKSSKRGRSKTYYRGSRGGCYYYSSKGKKQYVSRSLCN